MLQDTLRGSVLASVPFYDQKKVVALLDRLPTMSENDLVGWDPTLMSILSACVLQTRFRLGTPISKNGASYLSARRARKPGGAQIKNRSNHAFKSKRNGTAQFRGKGQRSFAAATGRR
jgi:hypothetical protein